MTEDDTTTASEAVGEGEPNQSDRTAEPAASQLTPGQYWLRVHGYPADLTREIVYYGDFVDLRSGPLSSNPAENLRPGDILIFYADGPASLYGVGTITGEIEGPIPDPRRAQKWLVPIKREALIRSVNKAPHAMGLRPPSGRHFLQFVRDYTYIRLPTEDGQYLVEQVKARASARD